ncbi:MAG: ArsA family ATPase, partial [Myxococcota bacterium]
VVCAGSGGVGKTTVSAAIALEAARRGRKTIVVTIDPAKRLATALGLELGHEVSHVRPNLDAVMVDTKHALDKMLKEYAPTPQRLDKIFASPLYQHLSSALVGSEEFAAMGLLHEYYTRGDYDLIVVDTPPARHALDFLTVNTRLLGVFASGLTQFLFKPGRLFSVAGGRVAKALSRWTSREYLETLSEFMIHFEDMFYEMEGRVRTMDALIRDGQRTSLALVAVPEAGSVAEALSLADGVAELGLGITFGVANRTYLPIEGQGRGEGQGQDVERVLLDHYARLARMHAEGVQHLRERVPNVVVVPALTRVAGIEGVERLVPYLRQ